MSVWIIYSEIHPSCCQIVTVCIHCVFCYKYLDDVLLVSAPKVFLPYPLPVFVLLSYLNLLCTSVHIWRHAHTQTLSVCAPLPIFCLLSCLCLLSRLICPYACRLSSALVCDPNTLTRRFKVKLSFRKVHCRWKGISVTISGVTGAVWIDTLAQWCLI